MKKRDLLRLPLGKYYLTDGIYNYTLTKFQKDWGDKMCGYNLREKGFVIGGSVTLYEKLENVFENSSYYKHTVLTFFFNICGLYAPGESAYDIYSKLNFVPKSSYKEWLKKVEGSSVLILT